jgi:HSP20 family protein
MKYLIPYSRTSFSNPLMEEFDKLFDSFFSNSFDIRPTTKNQKPKLNAYVKDDKYCIDAFIPFATKDDIALEIEENLLKLTINAHHDKEIKEDDFIIRELSRGQMVRVLQLGDTVNKETAKSSFKDGILHIEFENTKKIDEESKVKKIDIR